MLSSNGMGYQEIIYYSTKFLIQSCLLSQFRSSSYIGYHYCRNSKSPVLLGWEMLGSLIHSSFIVESRKRLGRRSQPSDPITFGRSQDNCTDRGGMTVTWLEVDPCDPVENPDFDLPFAFFVGGYRLFGFIADLFNSLRYDLDYKVVTKIIGTIRYSVFSMIRRTIWSNEQSIKLFKWFELISMMHLAIT